MVVNAGDIMTEDITSFDQRDMVGSVLETMEENSFDVAPIKISGYIRKFVEKDDLEDIDETRRVVDYSKEIQENHLVGINVPVLESEPDSRDLITILEERGEEFAFIVDDGIEGIVTRADFNQIKAGIPFFKLISEYEASLCDLINDKIEHNQWISAFDDETEKEIKDLYKDEKKENAELRLIDCLNTRQIHKVIKEYELFTELGFSDEQEAEEVLDDIEELRNDIFHQRPFVGKYTFSDFAELTSELKEANAKLPD